MRGERFQCWRWALAAPSYTRCRFPEKQPAVFLGMCERASAPSASPVSACCLTLCLTPTLLARLAEGASKHKHLSHGWQRGSRLSSHLIIFPKVFLVCHLSPYQLLVSTPRPPVPADFLLFCLPLSRLFSLPVVTFDPTQLPCVSGSCLSKMAVFVFVYPLVTVGPFSG